MEKSLTKNDSRGYKYLFEKSKKFRFEKIVRDRRFLSEQKELVKKIRHSDQKERDLRTFTFSLRWGISWKVDPRKSYKQNNEKLGREMLFPPPVSLELDTPILDNNLSGHFAVDLKYSDRAIMRSFQEQLKSHRDAYKEKVKGIVERSRLSEYAQYLRIYKLQESGWSWDRLAKRFYTGEDLNYAKQKIRRDYIRGKKLVEGHYRQIR